MTYESFSKSLLKGVIILLQETIRKLKLKNRGKNFPTFQKCTFPVLNVWYCLIKNTNMIVSMPFSVTKPCLSLCDPWTVACQTPLSMRYPGRNAGVGCYFPLQGISLTQGLNPRSLHLLHWQVDSLPLSNLNWS